MSTQKAIGPTFCAELSAYGTAENIVLIGQHFAWHSDGTLEFFNDTPSNVIAAVEAVYAAHDPSAQAAPAA